MAAPQLDLALLTNAIAKGVIDGTTGVVSGFTTESLRRHDLANAVQRDGDKIHELDGEVKLLKGMLVSLIGSGDGSTGMVPRLEKDMSNLKTDMTTVKGQIGDLTENVGKMSKNIDTILDKQAKQTSWTDGWRGVATFLGIMATCLSIVGGIIAGVLWLANNHLVK